MTKRNRDEERRRNEIMLRFAAFGMWMLILAAVMWWVIPYYLGAKP